MSNCKNCNSTIKPASSTIQCDACRGLIHVGCAGMSEKDAVVTRAKSRCIKVVCSICSNNMSQFSDFKALVVSIKSDFLTALDSLKDEFNSKLIAIKEDLDAQLRAAQKPGPNFEELVAEVGERELRKRNLIVFGVPEPSSDLDRVCRVAKDVTEVSLLLKSVDPGTDVSGVKPRRLGRYDSSNATKPRPILVTLDSESAVHAVIRNSKILKNIADYSRVSISFDKTPRQLQVYRDLRVELQTRTAAGETDLRIKYIRGVPKIIRLN